MATTSISDIEIEKPNYNHQLEDRQPKKVLKTSIEESESNATASDYGYHDYKASSNLRTSIIFMSLGVITFGFTYIIGLVVYIIGAVHFSKAKTARTKQTKKLFTIATILLIAIPFLVVIVAAASFSLSSISMGPIVG